MIFVGSSQITKRKWSIIHSFENKEKALELIEEYQLPKNNEFTE